MSYFDINDQDEDLSDFEAQLRQMESDIDDEFSQSLSQYGDSVTSNEPKYTTIDDIPTISTGPILTISDHNDDGEDTDTGNEFESLVHTSDSAGHIPHRPIGRDDELSKIHSHDTKSNKSESKGCHDKGCNDKHCTPIDPELEKYRQEQLQKEQEIDAQLDADLEGFTRDQSLTGYIFRQDFTGFCTALSSGRDPHELDFLGQSTALHHATFHEQFNYIDQLMKYGANINVRNMRGETPLMVAAKLPNIRLLAFLIENHKADPYLYDNVGLQPLHHAAEQGLSRNMSLFHTIYGVNINALDIYGKSALHWAAWAGHERAVMWLLRHGCSPYHRDTQGCYALHWAIAKCRTKVTQILFSYSITDGQSLHPRTVAEMTYIKHVRSLRLGSCHHHTWYQYQQQQLQQLQQPPPPQQQQLQPPPPPPPQQQQQQQPYVPIPFDFYAIDDTYKAIDQSTYNPIDNIYAIIPSHMSGYTSFCSQLDTPNTDGQTPQEFAEYKHKDIPRSAQRDLYKLLSSLKSMYKLSSLLSSVPYAMPIYEWFSRLAYLPIHYVVTYTIAQILITILIDPIDPYPYFIWPRRLFFIAALYNYWRVIRNDPGHLTLFTPLSLISAPDNNKNDYIINVHSSIDDELSNTNNNNNIIDGQQRGSPSDPYCEISSDSTEPDVHIDKRTCINVIHDCIIIEPCSPSNDPAATIPIPYYKFKQTLFTRYLDLMRCGEANDQNTCETCEIARPLRSKHCSQCNRCVSRFDHHCPFFHNDIAYNNYHNFLWFLIVIPIHWILFVISYISLWKAGALTIETLPSYLATPSGYNFVHIFFIHLVIYVIWDILLFSQHLGLLSNSMTTNELMNKAKYTYLSYYAIDWNPFTRGSWCNNFMASLGFRQHHEPHVLTKEEAHKVLFAPSPIASSWALDMAERQHAYTGLGATTMSTDDQKQHSQPQQQQQQQQQQLSIVTGEY